MSHDHSHGSSEDGECTFYHALVFHAGVCQEILFPGWTSTSALTVFGSAVALFIAGFLYEGLKYGREALARGGGGAPHTSSEVNITKSEGGPPPPSCRSAPPKYSMWSSSHAVQTLLYIVQTTCSYLLMLIFMTYNVWLCMGLVLGMGLGYFVFGWRKTQMAVDEHCS